MNCKLTILSLFSALLLRPSASFAEVLRWPQMCLTANLEVTNLTENDVSVWIQKFNPTLKSESENLIPANSKSIIEIRVESSNELATLLHFQKPNLIQAKLFCNDQIFPANSFEGGALTYRKTNLTDSKLWLQNLFTDQNTLTIDYLDRRLQTLKTENFGLISMQQLNFKPSPDVSNWQYLRVRGTARFSAFSLTNQGSEGPSIIDSVKTDIESAATYFVVGTKTNPSDQFTIKITNPVMIAKAREQISNPALEKIVFATVQKGNQGFNRNWIKKEKSLWSWSTSEVTNIADLGSTACNGFPQAVEDRIDSWIKDPGRICFWSYRILYEVTPEQVASGKVLNH
jgi:hypothetical protein